MSGYPKLRYFWHGRGSHDALWPPESTGLRINVGGPVWYPSVWNGSVEAVLVEWMAWCALQVAELWHAPPGVIAALSGDETISRMGCYAAAHEATCVERGAAWFAAWAAEAFFREEHPKVSVVHNCISARGHIVSALCRHLGVLGSEIEVELDRQFRTRILRHALPERLWPFIDQDERVLCDALLEQGVKCG